MRNAKWPPGKTRCALRGVLVTPSGTPLSRIAPTRRHTGTTAGSLGIRVQRQDYPGYGFTPRSGHAVDRSPARRPERALPSAIQKLNEVKAILSDRRRALRIAALGPVKQLPMSVRPELLQDIEKRVCRHLHAKFPYGISEAPVLGWIAYIGDARRGGAARKLGVVGPGSSQRRYA